MTNVEKLKELNILEDIQNRVSGWDWEEVKTCQEKVANINARIDKMDPKQIMGLWSGWHIGDPSWATTIIDLYEELKKTAERRAIQKWVDDNDKLVADFEKNGLIVEAKEYFTKTSDDQRNSDY